MSDRDKDPGAVERRGCPGHDILETNTGDLIEPNIQHFFDHRVPDGGDLWVFQRAIRHDFGGPERVAAVDKVDLRGKARQVAGLFACGITPADHHKRLVPKDGQGPIAGSAVGDPLVLEFVFPRNPKVAVTRTDSDDDASGLDRLAVDGHLQGCRGEVNGVDPAQVADARPEARGLLLHLGHQGGSFDSVTESRKVLDGRGGGEEPPWLLARDEKRVEIGPCGIDGGGPSGTTGSNNDDLFHKKMRERRRLKCDGLT